MARRKTHDFGRRGLIYGFVLGFSVFAACLIAANEIYRFIEKRRLAELSDKERLKRIPLTGRWSRGIGGSILYERVYRLSQDYRMVYEIVPNKIGWHEGLQFISNSQGDVDKEYPAQRPPGVLDIVCLGDSFTQGFGCPDPESSWTGIMERMLNDVTPAGAIREVWVRNKGVTGYNTFAECARFENYINTFAKPRHQMPHVVVIQGYQDDFDLIDGQQDGSLPLERLILKHVLTTKIRRAPLEYARRKRIVAESLARIVKLAGGAPVFMVVLYPPKQLRERRPNAEETELAALAKQNGAIVVDTLDAMLRLTASYGEDPRCFNISRRDKRHTNWLYNQAFAAAVIRGLARHGALPQKLAEAAGRMLGFTSR